MSQLDDPAEHLLDTFESASMLRDVLYNGFTVAQLRQFKHRAPSKTDKVKQLPDGSHLILVEFAGDSYPGVERITMRTTTGVEKRTVAASSANDLEEGQTETNFQTLSAAALATEAASSTDLGPLSKTGDEAHHSKPQKKLNKKDRPAQDEVPVPKKKGGPKKKAKAEQEAGGPDASPFSAEDLAEALIDAAQAETQGQGKAKGKAKSKAKGKAQQLTTPKAEKTVAEGKAAKDRKKLVAATQAIFTKVEALKTRVQSHSFEDLLKCKDVKEARPLQNMFACLWLVWRLFSCCALWPRPAHQ